MKYVRRMPEAFEKAIEIDSGNAGAHLGRGMSRLFIPKAFGGGDIDGAMSDFEFVLSKDSSNVQANLFIGFAYNRKNLKDKAIAHFERVLELDPNNQQAKQQLEQLR